LVAPSAATLAGAAEGATNESLRAWWRPQVADAVAATRALIDDPTQQVAVERGRRRRPIEWDEAAIVWLHETYPESAAAS